MSTQSLSRAVYLLKEIIYWFPLKRGPVQAQCVPPAEFRNGEFRGILFQQK